MKPVKNEVKNEKENNEHEYIITPEGLVIDVTTAEVIDVVYSPK